MSTLCIDTLEQAIANYQKDKPQDRTFKLELAQRTVWIKTPSEPRLRLLYTITNRIMVWFNLPYFQAPPHAGGPGGKASLAIEKEMLLRLKDKGLPVPEVLANTDDWLALSTVGEENLDTIMGAMPADTRLPLWQQAVAVIAQVHQAGGCLSQCFARNIMLKEQADASYKFYFLDFEEDPIKIMTLAQAQARDWALFLHSTAVLISQDREKAQDILLQHIMQAPLEAQQATQSLFKKLRFLRKFKSIQFLGRDSVRLYQLGLFADGILEAFAHSQTKT